MALLEVVAQKVKAARDLQVHEMGFLGMHPQAGRGRPALHDGQRRRRVVCGATQHDKIVGIPHHLESESA